MYVTAPITNIARGSLHDGPGVRTVVYLKGCTLHCKWCHNPETISPKKQILYYPTKCIHCGRCVEVCPKQHKISGNDMVFLREGCVGCGKCAEVCPVMALNLCGEEKTVDEVFSEIVKDRHYFQSSGGGVTMSGGECLLYPEFLTELLGKCRQEGIHTTIESAFSVPWSNIEKVISQVDLFFADFKIADAKKHREYTGRDNSLILENIRKLSYMHQNIIIRIPIIPGVNDSCEDILGFAREIRQLGKGIQNVELLKYNPLAESKYAALEREYQRFAAKPQSDEAIKKLCDMLQSECGVPCYFV